jgi:alginate O-acetyltransferase complex protein AlgI
VLFNTPIYFTLLLITFLFLEYTKHKKLTLIISSIIFFMFAGYKDFTIFYITLLINWLILNLNISKKFKLLLLIVFNLSLLFVFKYFLFFANFFFNFNSIDFIIISLPVGISFYIFQLIGLHIDSFKRKSFELKGNFSEFIIFISFFPQLIAGPIMRANYLIPQIKRLINNKLNKKKLIIYGLLLILMGLIKKIIFADNLSLIVDDIFFEIPSDFLIAWAGAFLFTFQIYFDFSGYSDIAIGSAYILGLRLIKNFNLPYFSISPSDFWRRWHISLSTWIRDYIYIPLGGSKKNIFTSLIILLITMGLAGLWHGANSTFIIWGILWSFYIFLFRLIKIEMNNYIFIKWLFNFIIITFLWVIFRSDNIFFANDYIMTMLNFSNFYEVIVEHLNNINYLLLYVFIMMLLFSTHFLERYFDNYKFILKLKTFNGFFLNSIIIILIFILTIMPSDNPNPFIYFKF